MSYVDQRFYDDLVAAFSSWDIEDNAVSDAKVRDQCRMLLEREARLLDQARYDEWLGMYTPQCAYWVPATPTGGDPRREVAVMFDDRRRLEDRVYRLKTGYAWSQAPASRTVRLVSNVEVFARGADLMVRSNFLISEFRSGESRILSGWCAHRLTAGKIAVKQVNLIDCDQNLRNPSLVL
jgi:3-phenylpropionate/cinnamic acid dioxygenase small subunit